MNTFVRTYLLLPVSALCLYGQTYTEDSVAVRDILDANGLGSVTVGEVSDTCGGRITTLNLNDRGISTLPATLGDLSALRSLSLRLDSLTNLPAALGGLADLVALDLHGNELVTLPASLCDLSSLVYLNVQDNVLTALPDSIGRLDSLCVLAADGNQLATLPESFGGLEQLQYVLLQGNRISALPASIGDLSTLEHLALQGNSLAELPASFGNLTALTYLDLHGNALEGLPDVGVLVDLGYLSLWGNRLLSLPGTMGSLTSLTVLDIYGNRLDDLPSSIALLSSVTLLNLGGNRLCALAGAAATWADSRDPDWASSQDCDPPDNPVTLVASASGGSSVDLTWNPQVIDSADADSVGIWYSTRDYPTGPGDGTATKEGAFALDITSRTVLGLGNATVYYFSLLVRDTVGNWSSASATARDTAKTLGGPELFDTNGVTSDLQAAQRTDGSDTVDIYYRLFDINGGMDTVTVEYRDGASGTWATLADLSGDVGPVPGTDSSVNREVKWYIPSDLGVSFQSDSVQIRVAAVDTGACMCVLTMAQASMEIDTRPPLAATDLTAVAASGTEILLSWTHDGAGSDSLKVVKAQGEQCPLSVSDDAAVMLEAGGANFVVVSGLEPHQTYSLAVFVTDRYGNWSAGVCTVDSISHKPSSAAIVAGGEQSGNVAVAYQLSDEDGDTLSIACQYSTDGSAWESATVTGQTAGIDPGSYSGSVVWTSVADLPDTALESVLFRARPLDGVDYGDATTTSVLLDNFHKQSVTLATPAGEQVGDVALTFSVSDPTGDDITFEYYYSVNGGANWTRTTSVSGPTSVGPDEYADISVVWESVNDVADMNTDSARFSIVPHDGWGVGVTDLTGVFSLNNAVHATVEASEDTVTGNAALVLRITAAGHDSVQVTHAMFSVDDGVTWDTATVSGDTGWVVRDMYDSVAVIWHSLSDFAAAHPGIRLLVSVRAGENTYDAITRSLVVLPSFAIFDAQPDTLCPAYAWDGLEFRFSGVVESGELDGGKVVISASRSALGFSRSVQIVKDSITVLSIVSDSLPVAGETITAKVLGSVTGIDGVTFDGNGNGEPEGTPTDDFSHRVGIAYLGDYNLDGTVDFDDVSYVSGSWSASSRGITDVDSLREIGPALGSAPYMRLSRDDIYNYEDLGVFVQMFYWCRETQGSAKRLRAVAKTRAQERDGSLVKVAAKGAGDSVSLSLSVTEVSQLAACRCVVLYDDAQLAFDRAASGDLLVADGADVLSLVRQETGAVEVGLARLSSGVAGTSGSGEILSVHFSTGAVERTTITAYYRLVSAQHFVIEEGTVTVSIAVAAESPGKGTEFSVAPSPAHPSTQQASFELVEVGPEAFSSSLGDGGVVMTFSPGEVCEDRLIPAGRGAAAFVSIYDAVGNLVITTPELELGSPCGSCSAYWSGHTASGRFAAPGTYQAVLTFRNKYGAGLYTARIGLKASR